jgi:hypothetical protein
VLFSVVLNQILLRITKVFKLHMREPIPKECSRPKHVYVSIKKKKKKKKPDMQLCCSTLVKKNYEKIMVPVEWLK